MLKNIKQYINNLVNPLLYYVDKNGNSIFRNFCLFKNNGNMYQKVIPIKDAGSVLEYRIGLSKKLKLYTITYTILLYLLFIHNFYSFKGLLTCELLWILLFFTGRIICSYLYRCKLLVRYGEYQNTDFKPNINTTKQKEYQKTYLEQLMLILIAIIIFITSGFILAGMIKFNANKKNPNYKRAVAISNIYTKFYPIKPFIFEIRSTENYVSGDFEKAAQNYIKAFELQNKIFTSKDYTKFANLLFLVKKSGGSQNAIDIFNEYATKKSTSTIQKTKLLWIKSMFSISNEISDFVLKDYDDLLSSLSKNDTKNKFYIQSDKAYMLYLMHNYQEALKIYNELIDEAKANKNYSNDLQRLYIERGYTKRKLGDKIGADADFVNSGINIYEIEKFEPKIKEQMFILETF